MPTTKFEYAVRDRSGKLVKGTLDAENQGQVVARHMTALRAGLLVDEDDLGAQRPHHGGPLGRVAA